MTIVESIVRADLSRDGVLGILGDPSADDVSIDMPSGLGLLDRVAAGEVAEHNRTTLLAALGMGVVLLSAVVLSDVLLNRSDLGRRRALGISRTDLTLLTILRTFVPATAGAVAAAAGVGVFYWYAGTTIPVSISVSVVVPTLVTVMVSALFPALWASRRDPVSVLRTP